MNNNSFDLYNIFWKRKMGGGDSYNYDITPLIKDFSFLDFIHEARTNGYDDYGAFIVISNKQYVIGYNAGFGLGSHNSSFSKVYKEIHGGGDISGIKEAATLNVLCCNNYITARIFIEKGIDGYVGTIQFEIPKNGISLEQFEVFEQFYEDYNKEISLACSKYGISNFNVSYKTPHYKCSIVNDSEELTHHMDNNLDRFREFLSSKVNTAIKVIDDSDEIIIGKQVNKKKSI